MLSIYRVAAGLAIVSSMAPGCDEFDAEMEALLLAEMRRLHDPYRLWDQPDDGLPEVPQPAPKPPKKPKKKTPNP